MFLLPEGGARFQVIHDELARREGVAAMRARYGDEHDLLARCEIAVAVDHRAIEDVPAAASLLDDRRDGALGHARIVLERHPHLAHQADERRHRTNARARRNGLHLPGKVEVLALYGDLHPPVTGGKNATSSPARIVAEAGTISWFTAIRSAFLSPSAWS